MHELAAMIGQVLGLVLFVAALGLCLAVANAYVSERRKQGIALEEEPCRLGRGGRSDDRQPLPAARDFRPRLLVGDGDRVPPQPD
jgi:hypothetical protein